MKPLNIIRSKKQYFIRKLKYKYDESNDLFYVYKKDTQVYSNVMIGDFHLEFSKERELIGIEIANASELLKEFGIKKETLEDIDKVELRVVVSNNSFLVFVGIKGKNQEKKSATITMNNLDSPLMGKMAEI